MAECEALLNPKENSYSCRWGLGSTVVSARFNNHGGDEWGDSERENTSGISSTKLWQSTESSVYDTEAEDSKFEGNHEEQSEGSEGKRDVKHEKKVFTGCCADILVNARSGSSEEFGIQYMQVEIQPFANERISGQELISAVMRVRCCGLLRWKLDDDKPHNCISLHFIVAVDKDIFDTHNLALEMDQALSHFATCSVAVKASGSQTHHYLVGGANSKTSERRPSIEENVIMKPNENKPSRLRKLLKSKSFLSSLSPFKSVGTGVKLSSTAGSTQSLDGLPSVLQDIATELKMARKEIKELQNHVYFLSRHVSNLTLERPKPFLQPDLPPVRTGHGNRSGKDFPVTIFGLDQKSSGKGTTTVTCKNSGGNLEISHT